MRRTSVFLTVLLVSTALGAFLAPAAATGGTLVADAGSSQAAETGSIALTGRAFGGTPPYAFAWSHDGSGARFADATAAATAFDMTGLAGAVTVTLRVTDAASVVATDAVQLHVGSSQLTLLNAPFHFEAGVPEETFISGLPLDKQDVPFNVPATATRVDATLSFDDGIFGNDIDLELIKPSGASADRNQGRTAANPERISVGAEPGAWLARIEPYLAVDASGTILVTATAGISMPQVYLDISPYLGTEDALELRALPSGGTPPYTFEWDTDHDGVFETAGQFGNVSIPATHTVRARVTDSLGYRAIAERSYDVHASSTVIRALCGGNDLFKVWAMEYSASQGTCWIHGGHHTYFVGDVYALRHVEGIAFSVEQQFAPPAALLEDPTTTPIHFQISMDGQAWQEVSRGTYRFISTSPIGAPERQTVVFDFDGNGEHFRFLRIHNPLSLSQGISGYLDHTGFYIDADKVDNVNVKAKSLVPSTRVLDCEQGHLMEDFFATHPCTFGGVDRYDSASFFHTYPVGAESELVRIDGQFTLAPFRTDDFFLKTENGTEVDYVNLTSTYAFVQTSVDGQHWTNRATVDAAWGVPTSFSVTLPGVEASFVRLFPQYHPEFMRYAEDAPLHHTRGYFLDSAVTVTGNLGTF